MPSGSWTVVEPSLAALTFTYSFGPGTANALALAVPGGVIVVSPPCNPPESAFTELAEHGPVKALVAPNAFHNMGLAAWRARFPEARLFAPAQSIARVEKQAKLSGVRPVAEMADILGDRIELVDMPHYKTGEALVRWRTEGGWAWYVTDVMMNFPEVPKGIFGTICRWTKSAPGLRRNAISGTFATRDKRALYAWLNEQADRTPPGVVVVCHGATAQLPDPKAGVQAALA